ncbi:uncharacterized protein LOC124462461 isoform X3 [Hypomesus transpacificus]|uniref:uncharacterized protein LOC124462461 isoform X3 n=1 Tax=Hypomesus transpacificus TaxID=137520 RepID=UPI001F079E7C|nr:uncharacterized protein LOC124462461 isoform X3 [Hypomesus transpacificus]
MTEGVVVYEEAKFCQKLQQKALEQAKQKKSKSAEFLMEEEERGPLEGVVNPAFDGGTSPCCQRPGGREMGGDRQDLTQAAEHSCRQAPEPSAERGNERARDYFDPTMVGATDPGRCGKERVDSEDELELSIRKEDEQGLYRRLRDLLEADEAETFLDLPGLAAARSHTEVCKEEDPGPRAGAPGQGRGEEAGALQERGEEAGVLVEQGRRNREEEMGGGRRRDREVIPCYSRQLRELVQADMITLGSLSAEQKSQHQRGKCNWNSKLKSFLRSKTKNPDPHLAPRWVQNPDPHLAPRAESLSLRGPWEQQGEVIANGNLTTELPGPSAPWAAETRLLWQEEGISGYVEVCVRCLRGVRDKLPRGLYSVSLALLSRLGATPLGQAEDEETGWARTTRPVEHQGRFFDAELHFNQSLVMTLPTSRSSSMVMMFQLLEMGSCPGGAVLGWAPWPLCGLSLQPVQGSFRAPLLRGGPSPRLDQFRKIEALMSSDLDTWLCNLYIQVRRLPSDKSGGSQLRVPLPIPPPVPQAPVPQAPIPVPQAPPPVPPPPHTPMQPQPGPGCIQSGGGGVEGEPTVEQCGGGWTLHLPAESACSSSSLTGKHSVAVQERGGGGADPVKGEAGMQHKQREPIRMKNPMAPHLRHADKQETLCNLSKEDMELYTFSLQGSTAGVLQDPQHTRCALGMLLSQLSPCPWRPCGWSWPRPLLALLVTVLTWQVRLYLHYCSQALMLHALSVPVNRFQLHAHTVELLYQTSLLHTREEMAMVVVGPLTLNAFMMLLVLMAWGCQLAFGSLPSVLSLLVLAQGLWTLLDPLAVFLVDAVLGNLAYSPNTPVGDAAKLYWHFYRTNQSGAAGVIITLLLYTVLSLLSSTILLLYLLRLHNDGRMLDLFQRLTAKEGTYFLPHDLELSNQELSYIVKKAEQWRGSNGERRKGCLDESASFLQRTGPRMFVRDGDCVGETVLGRLCWGDRVGVTVLGSTCWGDRVGETVLGRPCWGDRVGETVLG